MTTLPSLTWKALPVYVPTSGITNATAFIASLKVALEQTVYSDGTTRTPGSGIAWTPSTGSDGTLICTPASSSLGLQVLFSQYSASRTNQKMATTLQSGLAMAGNSYSVAANYVSMILNGTYSSTNVSEPVSPGGRFFGWTIGHWSGYNGYLTYCDLYVYESQDALAIVANSGGYGYGEPLIVGGFIDPGVDSSITKCAEIDGKVYGVMTSGYFPSWSGTDFWSGYTNCFMSNTNAANSSIAAASAGIFLPNSGSNIAAIKRTGAATNEVYVRYYTSGSSLANMPVHVFTTGSAGAYIGRLREISMFEVSPTGTTIVDTSGSAVAHVAGMNFNTTLGASFLLKA